MRGLFHFLTCISNVLLSPASKKNIHIKWKIHLPSKLLELPVYSGAVFVMQNLCKFFRIVNLKNMIEDKDGDFSWSCVRGDEIEDHAITLSFMAKTGSNLSSFLIGTSNHSTPCLSFTLFISGREFLRYF